MSCITEWVHDSCHIIRDTVVQFHDIRFRNTKIFSKSTVTIYTYTNAVFADVLQTTATVTAVTASDMSLTGNTIAYLDVAYTRTYLGYNTYILMTDGHWGFDSLLAPLVPLVDVEVGTADGSLLDLDEDIVHAYLGHGYFFHPNALHGLFLY